MVPSLNQNIVHANRVYHLQTEDSGVPAARVSTHLFLDGNVIASAKSSYADLAQAIRNEQELAKIVRKIMDEQHRRVAQELRADRYAIEAPPARKAAEPKRRERTAAVAAQAPPAAAAQRSGGARQGRRRSVDETTARLKLADLERARSKPARAAKGSVESVCTAVADGMQDVLACAVVSMKDASLLGRSSTPGPLPQKYFDAIPSVVVQMSSGNALQRMEKSLRGLFGGEAGRIDELCFSSPPVSQFVKLLWEQQLAVVLVTMYTIDPGLGASALRDATARIREVLA
jgi:hypothetical protein